MRIHDRTSKGYYEITYRYFHAPWDIGPRDELVKLVETESITPCRSIDLGCGAGANAIYLAQHGFDVTGVDFAEAAIKKARNRAAAAGASVNFMVDDFTNLYHVYGNLDFLLDYGVLDDLRFAQRALYLQNLLTLIKPGNRYLLWGFEYPERSWERFIPFYDIPFADGEIEQRFRSYFVIEKIAGEINWSSWPPGYAVYLMTRKSKD